MGCGVSKPEFWLIYQMSRRPHNGVTNQIAMHQHEEGGVDKRASSRESNDFEEVPMERATVASSTNNHMVVQAVEEKKMTLCNENDKEEGNLGSMVAPGSPSFRIYYTKSIDGSKEEEEEEEDEDEDESSRIAEMEKEKGISNEKSATRVESGDSTLSNEGLESKLSKKEKGRRLWALPQRTVAVYSNLHIRSRGQRKLLAGKRA